ncbi:metallophosphoesterase [Lederbergia lenta]|uniref:Metallophosphoesterase n=1 Tax=Lederbergia lenta TaxID=1467 RepID=A0A2X4VQR8_LEDLE|nr:metallophosphoesterase [Lederbergia lenta]MCM3112304.1 metallophosphoesterase [Lederbergia lenta]MEC2326524.1 metallophosphoesterase [Lederbergia lenta]SQI53231.1 metallophosphoesterase [Lederbergia lenta]
MKRKLFIFILLIAGIWIFLYVNNTWLQTTSYTIQSNRIPKAFDNLTIVQLSDLHDATFGEKQTDLANKVKKLKPDLIFLTGDLVDSNRYNLTNSIHLVEQLVAIADVYYVTGNHEVAVNQVDEIKDALHSLGVKSLTNEAKMITHNGEEISIIGINDPLMNGLGDTETTIGDFMDEALANVPQDTYKLLLSHRPEAFDMYVKKEVDLVFTGHAHGGQFRLPGIGGLVAPGQGWFPAYTAGSHERGITTMLVNRGLGNSLIPFRILNRPEIIIVTLKST